MGCDASALVSKLIPIFSMKASFGHTLSTTIVPILVAGVTSAWIAILPLLLPMRIMSPLLILSLSASFGLIFAVGRFCNFFEVAVSEKVEFRKCLDGPVISRKGRSIVALSIKLKKSGRSGSDVRVLFVDVHPA